jgi:hypothetical protein
MYGPPPDCKEKAEGEKKNLRKCIRHLVEHNAPDQDYKKKGRRKPPFGR